MKSNIEPVDIREYTKVLKEVLQYMKENHIGTDGITGGYNMLLDGGMCSSQRFEQIIVAPDGKILSCHEAQEEPEYQYGEVHENGEFLFDQDKILQIKKDNRDQILQGTCKNCMFRYLCLTGCQHRNKSESRNFFCELQKDMFREILESLFYEEKALLDSRFHFDKFQLGRYTADLIHWGA